MSAFPHFTRRKASTLLLGLGAALLVACIVIFPDQAFQSSLRGLTLWWSYVFPALLPFLIAAELLKGFGLLHLLAALLEPALRLLFRLPGAAGWALAAGFSAGYPAGAEAAAGLRRDALVSREEGERLLALSHLASPALMVGLVGAVFLSSVKAGLMIALIHYVAATIAGWIGCRPHRSEYNAAAAAKRQPAEWPLSPLQAMLEARQRDGRSLGKLLGDAVMNSVQTLFLLGGFMMMFSVLVQIVHISGVTTLASAALAAVLTPLGMSAAPISAAVSALFEVHLGTYSFSPHGNHMQIWQASGTAAAAWIGAALAWSGLACIAQVRSAIHGTDLRLGTFIRLRLLHAALAFALTWLLWAPLNRWLANMEPAVLSIGANASPVHITASTGGWRYFVFTVWPLSFAICFALLASFALLALLLRLRPLRSR